MSLTPKMERFAQLVALEGLSQSEAYRQAYNVSPDADPQTVWVHASHLAHHAKVAPRIAELRAVSQERAVVTATEILDKLKAIGFAETDPNRIRPSDKVAALDKMAKILGLYRETEPERRPASINQIMVVTVILDQRGPGARVVEQAPAPTEDGGPLNLVLER